MKIRCYENITNTEWTLCLKLKDRDMTTRRRHIINHSFNLSNENMPQHMILDLQIIYFFYEITWFAVGIVDLLMILQTEVSIVNDKF